MIKKIVTNIRELKKPCTLVAEGEDITEIVQDLKDSLNTKQGYGLAANQIGIDKRVSYIYYLGKELILINPKIVSKVKKYRFRKEGCLSFPGIPCDTIRYNYISFETGIGEERKVMEASGMTAAIIQHETDHLLGLTIFDRKR